VSAAFLFDSKPAGLLVLQPTNLELAINFKTQTIRAQNERAGYFVGQPACVHGRAVRRTAAGMACVLS